jgi:hypothetical protein
VVEEPTPPMTRTVQWFGTLCLTSCTAPATRAPIDRVREASCIRSGSPAAGHNRRGLLKLGRTRRLFVAGGRSMGGKQMRLDQSGSGLGFVLRWVPGTNPPGPSTTQRRSYAPPCVRSPSAQQRGDQGDAATRKRPSPGLPVALVISLFVPSLARDSRRLPPVRRRPAAGCDLQVAAAPHGWIMDEP